MQISFKIMDSFDDIEEPVLLSLSERKKKRSGFQAILLELWQRKLGIVVMVKIQIFLVHDMCMASALSADKLSYINGQLYLMENKVKHDAMLLSYMDIQQCKEGGLKLKM